MSAALKEWPLAASVGTTLLFLLLGERWLADLSNPLWFALMLLWPLVAILVSAFALVRHAESVTMFVVIMIVLNGLVGLCLVLGGLRYREQTLNLYGANAFLAVIIPLAVLVLVMPTFTTTTGGATSSPLQSVFLIFMSVGLYGTFLALQTRWHREYFIVGTAGESASMEDEVHYHGLGELRSLPYHLTLLLSIVTFMLPRTNVLLGAVHLLMFLAYLMLLFER